MIYRVKAPTGFTGESVGVVFRDGVAEVEASQTAVLGYFARRGYTVTPVTAGPDGDAQAEPAAGSRPRTSRRPKTTAPPDAE